LKGVDMSREELEKRILEARYNLVSSKDKETIDILEELAIKALEQEPILDKIRAEIDGIEINGRVDEHTLFIRTGEQVKQMALDIIDKYRKEQE
jgi:hypothetical protein